MLLRIENKQVNIERIGCQYDGTIENKLTPNSIIFQLKYVFIYFKHLNLYSFIEKS